ncbi:hypothetical protein BDV97DRAFT_365026 [Delphinella strobiligena]|nr:hypothetical protein BDV97DRAFT_365026 [Delphinella strobiligena]
MASSFERAVHNLNTYDGGRGIHRLLGHLDNHHDTLSLRATSRTFKNLRRIGIKAFETIYVHAPAQEGQYLGALAIIAPLCRSLVVKIAYPLVDKPDTWYSENATITRAERRRALREALESRHRRIARVEDDHVHERRHKHPCTACSTSTFDIAAPLPEPKTPKQKTSGPVAWKYVVQRRPTELNKKLLHLWYILLERFLNITVFTIACNGDPAWPGCTDIEMCLINLRICIERLNFKYLRTITLNPIHAMGIMHLRWAGLGAYGEAPSTVHPAFRRRLEPGGLVWQRLECLQLQIRNPYLEGRLAKTQIEVFDKVLADYLRSFKKTLKVLKLEWIDGGNGPDALPSVDRDSGYGDGTQSWANLEELWLANMTVDQIFLAKLEITAPVLQKVMVLGPQSDGAGGEMRGSLGASGLVWRDALQTRAVSRAESEAPSDTSRSIQIMLDL